MIQEKISFSFGENWKDFIKYISEEQIDAATKDILEWLGQEIIKNKKVIDIGSGSGINSLVFFKLGAEKVLSFDFDPHSVEATSLLWGAAGKPPNWNVFQGSILDKELIHQLGKFDIVYSWGVLHHTGEMWNAIASAASLVNEGGYFWITIYAKGPNYEKHLKLKRKYNAASHFKKRVMELIFFLPWAGYRAFHLQNPLKLPRGMDTYHDIVDWLGGLPYEVASEDEIVQFCSKLGLNLQRIKVRKEGACNIYVFGRSHAI